MFVVVAGRISIRTVLELQEIRLGVVKSPSVQQFGMFFFVSLTDYYIDVMLVDSAIIRKDVLNQRIRIVA